MPLRRLTADAFGVVTIVLVSLFVIFGVLCIIYSIYFRSRIKKQVLLQLGYFNAPWITRIAFVLVAIWWGFGEVVRVSLLKGRGRLFTNLPWQKNICKFYIISNVGFAEPSLFLTLVFLLYASLQKRESGALSQRWNIKTISCVILLCLPILFMQLGLVFVGPKFSNEERSHELPRYFFSTSSLAEDSTTCTYPLLSTALLGILDIVLICCVAYLGARLVSSVINKGLRRRVYILIFSVNILLPTRVILLGFSVLPHPGNSTHEVIVFLAFLALLFCALVAICTLVYYPVADSLALRGMMHMDIEDMPPFDDYYCDGASLIGNQSCIETGRNSDASTKRGSISFRTMIKEDPPGTADLLGDVGVFSQGALHISSPSRSPSPSSRPMIPLLRLPRD